MADKVKRYFPVVYLRNGDACVGSPCDTEEECKAELEKAVIKWGDRISSTTYMVRSESNTKEIFGSPNSRNALTEWGKRKC